jgi:PHP family Zn ribbon phosphoesterase
MTPNNIVNMASIKGLDVISVTDHNTARNLPAVAEAGENAGVKIVPGIEVTSREEVHILCYFKKLKPAVDFGELIYSSLPDIKNNDAIFGPQNIYDSNDVITGKLTKLLLNASSYTVDELCTLAAKFGGIIVPAHINKKSNGILGILGFIPTDLKIDFVEVYKKTETDERYLKRYKVLRNSDAHQLTEISEALNFIELESTDYIFDYLNL